MTAVSTRVCAQEIVTEDTLINEEEVLAADTMVNNDPEWYVAPGIPRSLRAPKRAVAQNCIVDSILSFNVDSILIETTHYDYDNAGRVTCATVWSVNADGTEYGSSKNEYRYDVYDNQVGTAVYVWNDVTNNWQGTEKYEYVYDAEQRMLSSISYAWDNEAWVADQKLTWAYDAAGRVTEYYSYVRDANTNQLVYATGRIQNWNDADLQTLDITYTAYTNGAWSAGTKKVWEYDANGNPVDYKYYNSISNGDWVGSVHEVWTYTAGNKTFYEKQVWENGAWVGSVKEQWEYTAGSKTMYVKYVWSNGTYVGEKKEAWGYTSGKATYHELYAWRNDDWVGSEKETWTYESNNMTSHEKQVWSNGAYVGSEMETWGYTSNKNTSYEKLVWENGVYVKSVKEIWAYSGSTKTLYEKYEGQNNVWVGTEKEVWGYTSSKLTFHETYEWYNNDWSVTLRDISAYDANGKQTLVENYTGTNGTIKGIKKEEYTFVSTSAGIKKTNTITYSWNTTNKVFVEKQWTVSDVDAAGNVTESCKYNYNTTKAAWVGSGARTLKTYDAKKNVTEEITQNWSTSITPNGWVNSKRTVNEFNGEDPISKYTFNWSSASEEWVRSASQLWTYNAAGLNDTIKILKPKGTEMYVASRTIKTYDSRKVNILTKNESWKNESWVMTSMSKVDVLFDEANHQLLKASWNCSADSIWKGVKKDTAAYSATGKKLFEGLYESWIGNKWVPSYEVSYAYDEADREILSERYDWEDGQKVGHYKYEDEYDAQNRKVMTASYLNWNYNTNEWIGSTKYKYIYEGERVAQKISCSWVNGTWKDHFLDLYEYDAAGHEIENIVQYNNNGQWENTYLYEHQYRGSEVIKNNSYEWGSNQWNIYSRYELYYDQNIASMLRREVNGSWSEGQVTSFSDYRYMYTCDPHIYTIRFVNYDGTLLESKQLQNGEAPVYEGETPTKIADAQHEYTFTNWSPEVVEVVGNTTYTAIYTATTRRYMITWLNDDNSQIDQTEVEYGVVPTHEDATKENTAEWTYEFTGWDVTPVAVTGTATYKATFNATKSKYMITWLNDDNSQIDQTEVEYGVVPTHANPTKENTAEYSYEFTGWDVEPVAVTGVATYKATFSVTKNKYQITWLNDDNTQIDQTEVEYGVIPTHADPTKQNTAEYSYEFTGWDVEPVAVTGVATYKATFSATKNKYQITWLNDDNTQIDQTEVEYGVVPTHADPTKENTPEYSYEFTGWNVEPVAVTGTATYKATFSATKNKYQITWLNDDDTQIDQTEVEYGVVPTHADPTKENTAEYSYEFTGWDVEPVAVTGVATYKATFSVTKNKYQITWLMDDGSMLDQTEMEYGTTPAHAIINKESTAKYTYTFKGWSPEVSSVTGEASYIAQFDSVINKYTVTFYFEDGVTVIKSTEMAYGEMPSIDITPSRVAEEHYYYVFAGWSPELTEVMSDATYTAIFNKKPKEYEILFKDWNGTQLRKANVAYGTMPEYTGATPERRGNAQYSYTFTGWSPELTEVTGNATYTAVYETVVNMYTVRFLDEDGTELENQLVAYGVVPAYQGETPTKEDDEEYRYIFAGWSPRVTAVTSDAAYYATYTAHKKTEGFESITDHQSPITNKIMIDGRIYIIRGGHTYTTDGTMVE